MRLTLRTLLAYLDDVLDAADARELAQKIKDSEVATNLVHRVRSVTRKLRLGAPKLSGKGMGLDANTVAEYLDSTLSQDQVPDFERICIESDVHLAEVASCHQILTLVLGEPADVDPELRERIRFFDRPASPQPVSTPGERWNGSADVQSAAPPRQEPPSPATDPSSAVPGISVDAAGRPPAALEPSIRVVPIAVTLLATFLLALIGLFMLGPLDATHPVVGRFFAEDPPRIANRPDTDEASRAEDQAPAESQGQPNSQAPDIAVPPDNQASPPNMAEATEALPPVDPASPPLEPEAATDTAAAVPADQRPAPSTADTLSPDQPDQPDLNSEAPADSADSDPNGPPSAAANDRSPEQDAVAIPEGTDQEATVEAGGVEAGGVEAGESAEKTPVGVGRYTSDQHVMARFDPATGAWFRLVTLAPLEADERLVALPTYRPRILLAPGIQLVLIGPAAIRLHEVDESGTPGITMEYGRLLAVTDGKSDSDLRLTLGVRESRVSFAAPDSTLALEVRHYHSPGTDPEEQPSRLLIRAFARDGQLSWRDVEPVQFESVIEPDHGADMIGNRQPHVHPETTPPWLDSRSLSLIDRDASKQLEPLLDFERPLSISLEEHVTNRLVEVRTLAIRCLALLDRYDPFVDALNQDELRSYWEDLFICLQMAIDRRPESAANVRSTFERLRGEEGALLYRMLWGYSPEQLAAGAAEQLVEFLSHPATDVRVLAFENLRQITGKTHLYRPDRDAKQQRRALASWNRALREGEIVYETPPAKISDPEQVPNERGFDATAPDG